VWIGAGSAILPRITIGTGSIVAAASVVTRSVPPYSIVGGNPAELIKPRFSVELADRLLESEWWQYRFTDFTGLDLSDPIRFLDGLDARRATLQAYRPTKIALREIPAEPLAQTPPDTPPRGSKSLWRRLVRA
jgi:virginiamycin A acetyltransferase